MMRMELIAMTSTRKCWSILWLIWIIKRWLSLKISNHSLQLTFQNIDMQKSQSFQTITTKAFLNKKLKESQRWLIVISFVSTVRLSLMSIWKIWIKGKSLRSCINNRTNSFLLTMAQSTTREDVDSNHLFNHMICLVRNSLFPSNQSLGWWSRQIMLIVLEMKVQTKKL